MNYLSNDRALITRIAETDARSTLDIALEMISVIDPDDICNDTAPPAWWAVCNSDGIIAYFADESQAFMFRLNYINLILNAG